MTSDDPFDHTAAKESTMMASSPVGATHAALHSAIAHSYGYAPRADEPLAVSHSLPTPAKPVPLWKQQLHAPAAVPDKKPKASKKKSPAWSPIRLGARLAPAGFRKPRSPAICPRPLSVPDFDAAGARVSPSKPRPDLFTARSERATPTRRGAPTKQRASAARGSPHPHFLPNLGAGDSDDDRWDHFVFMDVDSPVASLVGAARSDATRRDVRAASF